MTAVGVFILVVFFLWLYVPFRSGVDWRGLQRRQDEQSKRDIERGAHARGISVEQYKRELAKTARAAAAWHLKKMKEKR